MCSSDLQCRNRIVCLVIESALHVYKGQFSPWFGQFTIQISQKFSMGILIQRKFHSASGTVLSKRSTSRLGVSKALSILVSILHHHCVYHQLSGSVNSGTSTNPVYSLPFWNTITNQLGHGIEKSVLDNCATGTVQNGSQSAGLVFHVQN